MAKKKAVQPQRIFTKRQLSHWQQQKKRQRIILIMGISIIVAVIVIMGVGWYLAQYQPLHQMAIRVNDTEFNMKYYIEMLKVDSWNTPASYLSSLADAEVEKIERNELMNQGALKLGINVSDDEVKEELKSYSLPNKDVQRDLIRTKLLISKLLDEHFEQQVPVSAEQVHLMAMLLESEEQATEIRAKLEDGESFTELAEELSLDYFSKTNQGDFDWHPKVILNELLGANLTADIFSAEVGVLSQPIYDEGISKGVGYWLVSVLDRNEEEEEAHIEVMLLGNEAEAQEVISRLEAGEDFATLAKEFSRLEGVEENEGEYEITTGMISPAMEEFVFNHETALETISEPIRDDTITTEGGYWLIKVLAKDEDRRIDKEDRDLLKSAVLDEWVSSLWDDPENEVDDSYLDDEKKSWAMEQATKG
ncbi:MAG TPA: peptidylprolyl isomerase [Dehalococcoidales bacterium]|nr:peptidylprolyl isomerase [Dehalococcoidales bacterium]